MENHYKNDLCGGLGKTTEEEIKAFLDLTVKVAVSGRTDLRKARICYEVKTGAGELGDFGGKLVKGSSRVIYIPVINEAEPIEKQEGFVMSREVFLSILDGCGMIREKTSSKGVRKITIQTFWNRSKNAPHGTKYFKMLDAFYQSEEVEPFEEWLKKF